MRLVTRCPACTTTFKVVRDQLRISDGWVRCGRCSEVFDATQSLWEANDDGTPVTPLSAPQPAPPPAYTLAPPPVQTEPTFDADEYSEGEEPFDLGPDPPPASTSFTPTATSWPSADLLELGRASAVSAVPAAPAPAQVATPPIVYSGALAVPAADFTQRTGAGAFEPRFDSLPSLDIGPTGFPETSVQRREPAFSPQLTTPSPVVSPIEEAVNSQLKKALRRERVKALRQERAEKRERERAGSSAGDPFLGTMPAALSDSPTDRWHPDRAALSSETPSTADDQNLRLQREASTPTALPDVVEPAPLAVESLPSFAEEAPAPRRRAASWLWAFACLFALALLALQYLRHERDMLVAREPALRPALQALCDWTRCSLSPPRSIADISIDGASFSRETEGYRLVFTLRNRARVPLAMPAVELTLLDTQERALLRRVLLPAEYGAPGVLGAGAERNTSLPLRLAGPDASGMTSVAGYRLVAFYP